MTIREEYNEFVKKLQPIYEEREAQTIADWIFEDLAHIPRLQRATNGGKVLTTSTLLQLNKALDELLTHKPVQYVLGEAWFYKMRLKVNEHVLIPRPETEEIVQWIVADEVATESRSKQILDIGTGSGCISIALKKELPASKIMAIDVSQEALALAHENATQHHVEIDTREINFLESANWNDLPGFDIIVSNPPYIPASDKKLLATNVVDFEPSLALFVDDDALIFYKSIATFAQTHLNANGKVYVEIHEDYAKAVESVFKKHNFKCEIRKYIYGRDRMLSAVGAL